MFVACGIWCLADVSSVSTSWEQTGIFEVEILRAHKLSVLTTNLSVNQDFPHSCHFILVTNVVIYQRA